MSGVVSGPSECYLINKLKILHIVFLFFYSLVHVRRLYHYVGVNVDILKKRLEK